MEERQSEGVAARQEAVNPPRRVHTTVRESRSAVTSRPGWLATHYHVHLGLQVDSLLLRVCVCGREREHR